MGNGDLKVTVRVELDDSNFASQIQSLLSQYEGLEIKIKAPQIEGGGKQVDEQKGKWQQWKEAMQETSDKVVDFGQTATKEGSKLSNAFKPVVEFGEDCIKTASEVDYLQTQIAAISGVDKTNKAYTTLQQTISDIAKSSKFTGAEVSETALVFTKAGFSLDQTNQMLEATKNGALASGIDMTKMASGVGNAIRSFNLDASDATRVIDVLSKTANMSNTDLSSMITTLSNCSGTAGTLGLDITQVAGALGTMSNQGMQAGKASTQLRNIMLTLAEGSVKYSDGLNKINVATVDSQGNFRSLTDIFGDLSTQCEGMTEAQKVAFAETLVGKTNVEGFLDLLNNSDSLSNFNLELQSCEGTAKNFADTMGETTQGKMDTFNSQLENMKTSIGDKLRPAFENILDVVGKFCDVLSNSATAEIISFGIEFGALVVAIGTGIKVFGLITTAIGLLCSPIGMVVAGIALLGTAIYEVCSHFDFLKEVAGNCWEAIKTGFKTAVDAVVSFVGSMATTVISGFQNIVSSVVNFIANIISTVGNGFKTVVSNIGSAMSNIISVVGTGFKTVVSNIGSAISSATSSVVSGFHNIVSNIGSSVSNIISVVSSGFRNVVSSITSAISSAASSVASGFGNIVSAMRNGATNAVNAVVSVFSGLGQKIMSAISGVVGTIQNWWGSIKNIFAGGISASVNITKHVTEGSLSASDNIMTLDNNNEFTTLDSSNNILSNNGMSLSSLGVNTNNIKALDRQTFLLEEILEEISDKPQVVNTTVNCEVKNDIDIDRLAQKIEANQKRALRKSGARLGLGY